MALPRLIASRTSIAGYAELLLGGHMILHSIANTSSSIKNQYRRVLVSGRTILHGIANGSLRVHCFRNQYHRVLLGGCTILHGITNYSLRVNSIKNEYRQVHKVPGKWAHDFA